MSGRAQRSARELAGARARKEHYRGTCIDCGRATTGCNGPGRAPERCLHCAPKARAIWTREAVVAAFQRFAAEHGRPPTVQEWRRRGPDSPAVTTVQAMFGSWANVFPAAGFPRPTRGRRKKETS